MQAVLIVLFVFACGEEAQKESAQVDDLFAIKPPAHAIRPSEGLFAVLARIDARLKLGFGNA